jgi:hypothetical protein
MVRARPLGCMILRQCFPKAARHRSTHAAEVDAKSGFEGRFSTLEVGPAVDARAQRGENPAKVWTAK